MKKTWKYRQEVLLCLLSMFLLFLMNIEKPEVHPVGQYSLLTAQIGAPSALAYTFRSYRGQERVPDTLAYRIARRLRKRLHNYQTRVPSLNVLANAVLERQDLLKKRVHVQFQTEDDPEFLTWYVSLHRYPLWIKPEFSYASAHFRLSAKKILNYLVENRFEGIPHPVDVILFSVEEEPLGPRAVTSSIAKEGLDFDVLQTVDRLYRALREGEERLSVPLHMRPGRIVNRTDKNLGRLELLATGQSNFRGSSPGRRANIHKGLREHMHNAVVAPGEIFSFNKLLDPPVSMRKGWHMAQIIYKGEELRMAPGGGICQVSTTFYRALVNAGLPVVDRRSHSLYVSYYEKHGVGIDATIFPGYQDLKFRNDTPNHLLIQAYDEGDEAVVNIYGTPDGRTVELKGPYFGRNAPDGFKHNGRSLWRNEIAWVQRIRFADGEEEENIILSRYKELPERIVAKYVHE